MLRSFSARYSRINCYDPLVEWCEATSSSSAGRTPYASQFSVTSDAKLFAQVPLLSLKKPRSVSQAHWGNVRKDRFKLILSPHDSTSSAGFFFCVRSHFTSRSPHGLERLSSRFSQIIRTPFLLAPVQRWRRRWWHTPGTILCLEEKSICAAK